MILFLFFYDLDKVCLKKCVICYFVILGITFQKIVIPPDIYFKWGKIIAYDIATIIDYFLTVLSARKCFIS